MTIKQELSELDKSVIELENKMSLIRNELTNQITHLPDNSNIKRLANNCFVTTFGSLGNNWSPEYHDFKHQYRTIVEEINSRPNLHQALQWLKTVMKEGSFVTKGSTRYMYKFHPEVIKHVSSLL